MQKSAKETTSTKSPSKWSRLHEKQELTNLNDRLACYIDKVRNLEVENSRLTREVNSSQESIKREVVNVKSLYESELTEVRKLVDELSREKAEIQIDARRLFVENEELKISLDKSSKDSSLFQTSLTLCESKLADIKLKYHQILDERKRLEDESTSLKVENKKFSIQITDAKRELEKETLRRVELENTIQNMREDLEFKEKLFENQITELRNSKVSEMSQIDEVLAREYEDKMYHSLQEIREQYEVDLTDSRKELKKNYEDKIRSIESQVVRYQKTNDMLVGEIKILKESVNSLNIKTNILEEDNKKAFSHVRNLEKSLEKSKLHHLEVCKQKEDEIIKLSEDMDRRNTEFQDLMDMKMALDLEISAYRKLLEGEEERLNIAPVHSSVRSSSYQALGAKRKRIFRDKSEVKSPSPNHSYLSNTKCDIAIAEVCKNGRFITLINKTNKSVNITNWLLNQVVGKVSTSFEFENNFTIEPKGSVTVWSSGLGEVQNEPPENIIMENEIKWLVGNITKTTLYDSSGNEMAVYELRKIIKSNKNYSCENLSLETSSPLTSSSQTRGDEKCLVM